MNERGELQSTQHLLPEDAIRRMRSTLPLSVLCSGEYVLCAETAEAFPCSVENAYVRCAHSTGCVEAVLLCEVKAPCALRKLARYVLCEKRRRCFLCGTQSTMVASMQAAKRPATVVKKCKLVQEA